MNFAVAYVSAWKRYSAMGTEACIFCGAGLHVPLPLEEPLMGEAVLQELVREASASRQGEMLPESFFACVALQAKRPVLVVKEQVGDRQANILVATLYGVSRKETMAGVCVHDSFFCIWATGYHFEAVLPLVDVEVVVMGDSGIGGYDGLLNPRGECGPSKLCVLLAGELNACVGWFEDAGLSIQEIVCCAWMCLCWNDAGAYGPLAVEPAPRPTLSEFRPVPLAGPCAAGVDGRANVQSQGNEYMLQFFAWLFFCYTAHFCEVTELFDTCDVACGQRWAWSCCLGDEVDPCAGNAHGGYGPVPIRELFPSGEAGAMSV